LKKTNSWYIATAIAGILVLTAGSAFAGTATSNMAVSATVSANCTIAAGALAFGAYDPIVANAAAPLPGTATINVTCTNAASTTITLDQGLNPAGGSTNAAPLRQMASGGSFLSYGLFQDNAHSITWGNTAGTGVVYTGTGVAGSVTVFGQVPATQNVPSGTYNDTVVATITF
jgi:spore coat protein U-like protein